MTNPRISPSRPPNDGPCADEFRDALVEHRNFRRADLTGADLRGATFRFCEFTGARLDRADLTDARLVMCSFDDASLRDSVFHDAITVGCSFAGADLFGVREIAGCRDLVVEILRREAGDDLEDLEDLEALEVVGAVALVRKWCYEEWWSALADRPHLRRRAVEIFAARPESGFLARFRPPA